MSTGYLSEQPSSDLLKKAFIITLLQKREYNREKCRDYRARLRGDAIPLDSTGLTLFFAQNLLKIFTSQEGRRAAKKRYKKNHPEKVSAQRSARNLIRSKTDPNWKLRKTYRDQIYHALKGSRKSAKGRALLGCDFEFFRDHIEKQFTLAMTWKNHGTAWELDHILPCAEFHLQHSEEQEVCFHWTNFQPLLVADNRTKGDKIL